MTASGGALSHIRHTVESRGGRVLFPDDPSYEESRRTYNRIHDHRPAALVRTCDPAALREVIAFAMDAGLEIAIRGGGHHIGGLGTTDGGIVLDFCTARRVTVDAVGRVLCSAPGARLCDVDAACVPAGVIVPTGTVSDTGIAGLTLGGGKGWMTGYLGLTCDRLVGADVLLADGSVVRAEESEHAPLLWALRGGGGNFGVVLEFRFALHRLPKTYCGSLVVEWDRAATAFKSLIEYLKSECPRQLTVAPTLGRTVAGRPEMRVDFCYADGDPGLLRPLLDAVRPSKMDDVGEWDFSRWQSHFDSLYLPPLRGYWKASYQEDLSEKAISDLLGAYVKAPAGRCSVIVEHMHGAFRDFDSSHGAFGHRDSMFSVLAASRWECPCDDATRIAWVRSVIESVDPAGGSPSYLNYSAPGDGRQVTQLYGANIERLLVIKQTYDPRNVFRRNHNIRPRGVKQ
jgi:FAD/FMN-containing dehydrogenase